MSCWGLSYEPISNNFLECIWFTNYFFIFLMLDFLNDQVGGQPSGLRNPAFFNEIEVSVGELSAIIFSHHQENWKTDSLEYNQHGMVFSPSWFPQ